MPLDHLELNYTARHIADGLEPVDDDQRTINDVTVTRTGGTSARAQQTTGPLSTAAPPAGVGRYDAAVELSLWRDTQVADQAAWRLWLGTIDEARFPSIPVNLSGQPALIPTVTGMDCGDVISLLNLPAWVATGTVRQLMQGYTETFAPNGAWTVTFNASPYTPWRVAKLDSATYGRLDSATSTTVAALTATQTTMDVAVATGSAPWITTATHPTHFPFNAVVGGEEVTVTGITGAVSDTFTRTVAAGSWGTANSGQAWTVSGTASYWSVNGSRGVFTNGAAVNVTGLQEISGPWQDVDLRCEITFQSAATGGFLEAGLRTRRGSTAKNYVRLFLSTAGAVTGDIVGGNGGTVLKASSGNLATSAVGVPLNVRFLVVGQSLKLKVWAVGANEPDGWAIDATDTVAPAGGGVAVYGMRQTGNTNADPVTEFDNFQVVHPQKWTVTRSVNGIVKTHAAGTQVRLAQPVAIAL